MDMLQQYAKKLSDNKNIIGLLAVQRHCDPKMEFLHGFQQTICADELRSDFYDLVTGPNKIRTEPFSNDEMSVIFIGA